MNLTLRESLLAFRRAPLLSALSVTTIAFSLFVIGLFGLVAVNLRHALYSASFAPRLKHLSPGWKAALAYFLTDEAYAVAASRYAREGDGPDVSPNRHWYFLGAGVTLWAAWQVSTAAGVFIGAAVHSH